MDAVYIEQLFRALPSNNKAQRITLAWAIPCALFDDKKRACFLIRQ
jgi:hypothetical protein